MKKKTASLISAPVRPIDILLPEGKIIYGGAIYKRFQTLPELEEFWAANRDTYPFAIKGINEKDWVDQYGNRHQEDYLSEGEWIFSTSKESAIKALTRWDETGLRCELYDLTTADPLQWQGALADGADPSTAKWWRIANVYCGDPWDGVRLWEDGDPEPPGIELSVEAATTILLEQLFDCLQENLGDYDCFLHGHWCHDRACVDEEVEDWREYAVQEAMKAADKVEATGGNRFTTWLAGFVAYGGELGRTEFTHEEIEAAWIDYCSTRGWKPENTSS